MPAVLAWLRRRPATPAEAAEAEREKARRFRRVFGSPEGQEVLADLLRRTGVLLPSYGEGGDARADAYREGQRAVGLYLVRMVTEHPDAALKLARTGQTEGMFDERD